MPRNYYIPRWAAVIIAVIVILFLISALTSCYNQRKAASQFAKASIAYPEILAKTCVDKYPIKTDTIVKGVTETKFDTLYVGEAAFDTVYSFHKDTVFITKYLPGKTIIQTNFRTDTVYQENTAKLDLCEIERRAAVLSQDREHKELLAWKKKAKQRFWVILGLGAVVALGIFGFIRKKLTKPLV